MRAVLMCARGAGAGPGYQGYYQAGLMKTACTVAPQLTLSSNVLDCSPPWLPLNGSAFMQYNSTSYNDDMAWAATWMYRCGPLTDIIPCAPLHA